MTLYKMPTVRGGATVGDWREARRRSARADIVEAAWSVVRELGLAGLTMRDLATRAGVTTPTLYAYFDSKNEIYDAMFTEAATQFAAHMAPAYLSEESQEVLVAAMGRFVEFCTADVARYQLIFQRTIPGFEPSAGPYAHAVAALDDVRRWLHARGVVSEGWQLDLLTALMTGLVDDAVAMVVAYCRSAPHADNRESSTVRNRADNARRGRPVDRPVTSNTRRRT
jgi:AcrR family transcriptional regulator